MRERLIRALVGFVSGIILTSLAYSFYVSFIPQAGDIEKGFVLLFCVFATAGLTYFGFRSGGDP